MSSAAGESPDEALVPSPPTVKAFEFSIIASGLDPSADDFETRYNDAGCDDATVSFQKGHIILDFAREAESADGALPTAVSDVRKAGATIVRVRVLR